MATSCLLILEKELKYFATLTLFVSSSSFYDPFLPSPPEKKNLKKFPLLCG